MNEIAKIDAEFMAWVRCSERLMHKLTSIITNRENISAGISELNEFSSLTWCPMNPMINNPMVNNVGNTWCLMVNSLGNTLLQTCIIHNNKEAFDYLLPFHDIVSLEKQNWKNETALSLAIKNCKLDVQGRDYFALELIESGAYTHKHLNLAVVSTSSKVVALLLEKGIDVNVQNDEGNTALHTILMCNDEDVNVDEMVAVLMYYNADPLIENSRGYIPFEYAVRDNHKVSLLEILFLYTFDKYTDCKINMETVICLAESKSPLFNEIFKYNMTFKYNTTYRYTFNVRLLSGIKCFRDNFDSFNSLLNIDSDRLELITTNCNSALKEMISWTKFPRVFSNELHKLVFVPLTSKQGINNLNILLESETKPEVISLLTKLESNDVFTTAIANNSEEVATEILTYLLSYGLHLEHTEYHTVYKSFGYCNLFKLLLHIDQKIPCTGTGSIIPRVIYDIHLDHEEIFEGEPVCENSLELLDYFAHPKLADYLMKCKDGDGFSEETLARIERHPRIPLLEELARNVFRKHLTTRFRIRNKSLFYSYVNWLPISDVHKKIITYEIKLYR